VQRVQHTPAYLLHQQPWGDNGRICELFSREHGRLSVFARGVRGSQARLAGVLQPFIPLLVSWAGRGEAPRLTGAERNLRQSVLPAIAPDRLLSAFYVSELTLSLTVRHDPQPQLYDHYAAALAGLRTAPGLERELRLFEKRLLEVIGYGLPNLDAARFDDPAQLPQLRQLLRAALARCLEGRSLKTRVVAQSLRQLQRGAAQEHG
jgi:DNA repair protein RecO (recombination protein O)